jgi:hypothetical protein
LIINSPCLDPSPTLPPHSPTPILDDPKHHIRLYHGDCLEILEHITDNSVDLVFADPPYFLSNGGITWHAGKMASVNKGEWDKPKGADATTNSTGPGSPPASTF